MTNSSNQNIIFIDKDVFINQNPEEIHQYLKEVLNLVVKRSYLIKVVLNDIFDFIIKYSSKSQLLDKNFKNKLMIYFNFIKALRKTKVNFMLSINLKQINLSSWIIQNLNLSKIDQLDYLNEFLKNLNKQKLELDVNQFPHSKDKSKQKIKLFVESLSKQLNVNEFIILDFDLSNLKIKKNEYISRYKILEKIFEEKSNIHYLVSYNFFKLVYRSKLNSQKFILLWNDGDFKSLNKQKVALKKIAKSRTKICFDINNLLSTNDSILFFVSKIKSLFALSKFLNNSLCLKFLANFNLSKAQNLINNTYSNKMILEIALQIMKENSHYDFEQTRIKVSRFSKNILIKKINQNQKQLFKINYSFKNIKEKDVYIEPFDYTFLIKEK
ncbi:hypothetical protein NPA08_01745 [Mycoplasmopsis citelli]|uniref:hypothetical protein n=1 Tax=Mycoplasmopsis citelli TaxID=171281 RepID=UPI00211566F8|nr:hypothetical protein [Mycoplasmopsis citelli]UUD36536.1 hypothetical protein NPA08_01745 [Mycoplasmopsis citelli]